MPTIVFALAPPAVSAYILRMIGCDVKPKSYQKVIKISLDSKMILSVTGFAAVAAELPGVAIAVELRSVNHRYLDLQVRLPDELRTLEAAVREQLVATLRRGKVECRVSLTRTC